MQAQALLNSTINSKSTNKICGCNHSYDNITLHIPLYCTRCGLFIQINEERDKRLNNLKQDLKDIQIAKENIKRTFLLLIKKKKKSKEELEFLLKRL